MVVSTLPATGLGSKWVSRINAARETCESISPLQNNALFYCSSAHKDQFLFILRGLVDIFGPTAQMFIPRKAMTGVS